MGVPTRQHRPGAGGNRATGNRAVTAHRTTPERTVFTEADNTDGWISTDVTVDPVP